MKKLIPSIVIIAVIGAGIWYAFGGQKKSTGFGGAVGTQIVKISDITSQPEKFLNQEVTVEGQMTKECLASGCWWYIKDATGEIRADSFGANFSLPLNQVGKHVRTTGTVVKTDGGDLQIAATGASLK